MALEADIVTKLKTNATLVTAMTGGILSAQGELGGLGFSKATYPNAWTNHTLKPTLIVRMIRDQVTLEFGDEDLQLQPTRSVVKIELFIDRGSAHSTIEAAREQVYKTLHNRSAGGKRILYQDVDPSIRVKEIDFAYGIVETYFVRGVRRPVS